MTFIPHSFWGWIMKKKSLIVSEKKPLLNPNDFIHDFLLILRKRPCLLTSKRATPPSPTIPTSVSLSLRMPHQILHKSVCNGNPTRADSANWGGVNVEESQRRKWGWPRSATCRSSRRFEREMTRLQGWSKSQEKRFWVSSGSGAGKGSRSPDPLQNLISYP